MRRIITSIAVLLAFAPVMNAQELCGFEKNHKQLMLSDPSYKENVRKMTQDWVNYARMKETSRLVITGNDTVYEIPLVIHVVHTGGPIGSIFNPPDQQLIDLVDYVNQTYQAMWSSYPNTTNGGTRIPFKIVLAARDPNCQPTNGIVRVDGSVLSTYATGGIQSSGASDVDVKALSKWPNDRYYNVWVVNKISDPGVAGYAYYPGAGPAVDGTVILAAYSQSGSSTLVHELGHGMGLPHTFEGDNGGADCPPNVDCLLDGDGICDTEPHKRGVTCTDIINSCTTTPLNNTQFSFMSYTQGCRDRFTPGQRDKVLWNLKNMRASLMNSDGGVPAPPALQPIQCVPTAQNPGSPANVGPQVVSFNNIYRTSGGYDTEGIHTDNFCSHNTEVFAGVTYPISITTGSQLENVRVYIDYNNDGVLNDPLERVYNSPGTLPNQVHTGIIPIPAIGAIMCQGLRMRVITDLASAPAPAPCGALAAGQAEDYVITIKPSTGAGMLSSITSAFPGCVDSTVSFLATTTNVPAGTTITWTVNGQVAGSGSTFSTSNLNSGDVVRSITTVMNPTCGTLDSIKSNSHVITFQPGPQPPSISFVGGNLVADSVAVQWFSPSGLVPGATNQTYHPTEPGNHYAIVRGNPCPSDKSNILNVTLLSIGEYSFENVKIYPNPVSNELIIDWGTDMEQVQIEVINTLGQSVVRAEARNEAKRVIPMQQLANGIYFVKMTCEGGKTGAVRIVVQH